MIKFTFRYAKQNHLELGNLAKFVNMVIFLFNNLSFANLLSYFLISVSLERGKFKGTRENLNHKNWDQLGSQQSSFLLNPDFTEFHLHTRLFFLFLQHGYYIPQFQHARMNEGFPTPLCIRELRKFKCIISISQKGTFINDVLDQGTVVPFFKHFDK